MFQALNPMSSSSNLCSKYINIKGARMHYLEAGKGKPILFIHGMPTYSYLWRHILPSVSTVGRCIAVDLIGMGLSDKPEIDYTIFDHIDYLTHFINALELQDVTLVVHDWGSVAGFHYASRNESNVNGLVFYESHVRANVTWKMLSLPVQHLATRLDSPEASYKTIVEKNYLIKKFLPHGMLHKLSAEELRQYEKPFQTEESRKPLWQYVQELPLGDGEGEVVELIEAYSAWLEKTTVPKLMMFGVPGFITTIETVQWAKQHLSNLTLIELDEALHFVQESNPEAFSTALKTWFVKNS